jgi:hypothetical protein
MAISIFHCCCCSWPAASCVSSREVARHGNLPREKEYGDHTWQSWSRGHQFQKKNKAIPSLQDWMAGGLCMDKYHIETHHPTHTAIVICIKEISVKWLHVGNTDRFFPREHQCNCRTQYLHCHKRSADREVPAPSLAECPCGPAQPRSTAPPSRLPPLPCGPAQPRSTAPPSRPPPLRRTSSSPRLRRPRPPAGRRCRWWLVGRRSSSARRRLAVAAGFYRGVHHWRCGICIAAIGNNWWEKWIDTQTVIYVNSIIFLLSS